MADLAGLLADLRAESEELDALVAGLSGEGLAAPTPADGWTIAHQISHLAWADRWAVRSARDPDGFRLALDAAETDAGEALQQGAADGAGQDPDALIERWRSGRGELLAALAAVPEQARLPWFGPPMKPASMATARIMETWAHGLDVADALGVVRMPTGRLRHIAHLGVRTMGFAFALHGLDAPGPMRVELTSPSGTAWTWGPSDSPDRIRGTALDFSLLVTQRRHPSDLSLITDGPSARTWLPIAQAFAGPPGPGRSPVHR